MSKLVKHIILWSLWTLFISPANAQHTTSQYLHICFDSLVNRLYVKQTIIIDNKSQPIADTLLLLNWVNAYRSKKTALARRFIENYDLNFHFTRQKNRGNIRLTKLRYNGHQLNNFMVDDELYKIPLPINIASQTDTLDLSYEIKLPKQKFTGLGIDKNGNILLENFYFLPVFDKLKAYRNMNIDDYPSNPVNFTINLCGFSSLKKIYANFPLVHNKFQGKISHPVILYTDAPYETYHIDSVEIVMPVRYKQVSLVDKNLIMSNIVGFLNRKTTFYKPQKFLITHKDFSDHKVYGPDLLPKFFNPYKPKLLWEAEVLHQLAFKYSERMQVDTRQNSWLRLGVSAFLEYAYFEKYHPDMKLLGKLSEKRLIKYYYASQIKMNEKYPWLYLYMARMNKDQALRTSLDSLSNFNRNVANPFKAALSLVMLQDRLGDSLFHLKFGRFYRLSRSKHVDENDFFNQFNSDKRQSWLINYIQTRRKYDYKLMKVVKKNDTTYDLLLRNKKNVLLPLTVFGVVQDSVYRLKYLEPFKHDTLLHLHTHLQPEYIGVNYYNNYPELQIKNNYKKTKKGLFAKSLQIRLYQDFDNPLKNQLFVNPFFEYNYYDGVIIGAQIYNESFLHNDLNYSISPSYSTKDGSLTGGFSFSNSHYFEDFKPYAVKYGFNFKYYHYNHNLAYRRYNPYLVFKFRNKYVRKRQGSNLLFQYMYIDKDPLNFRTEADHYAIFNLNYAGFDVNVIKDFFYKTDLQLASKFGKISGMLRYRYLSNKNRQWDFRLYAGYFLYNRTSTDYFSFALDRPTDYLFQYHYYGRSESSGIFHQQFIWSEGGFKTFFKDQFANEYIISNNINIGIWKWLNLYGDWAWKKNKDKPVSFYYDSGVRINLVQDYFEVFFPIYSKLGCEINQSDYWQRVRLVFTIDINGLFHMVRRGWY